MENINKFERKSEWNETHEKTAGIVPMPFTNNAHNPWMPAYGIIESGGGGRIKY